MDLSGPNLEKGGLSINNTFYAKQAGTYYVGLSSTGNTAYNPVSGEASQGGIWTGSYTLTYSITNLILDETEPNDSIQTADEVSVAVDAPATVRAYLGNGPASWDKDHYTFFMPANTVLKVTPSAQPQDTVFGGGTLRLLDASGTVLAQNVFTSLPPFPSAFVYTSFVGRQVYLEVSSHQPASKFVYQFTFELTSSGGNPGGPTVSPIPNQQINEEGATGPISFTVNDSATPASDLAVAASSSNTILVPNANIVLGGSGANRTVTVTPAGNQNGVAQISVAVTDGDGNVTTNIFVVTVNPTNDPPTFLQGDDQNVADDAGEKSITGWATNISAGPADEAGQALTFVVTANSKPELFSAQPAISPNGTLTFTPALKANGSATITLVLKDNGGGNDTSAEQFFIITVTDLNRPPVLAPVGDKIVNEGGLLTFTASATDPDLPANMLTFSLLGDSPQGATITNDGLFSWAPNDNQESGKYSVTIRVTDNGDPALFSEETITITLVKAILPPETSITDQPPLLSGSTSASFSFTGMDSTALATLTFLVQLDDGPFLLAAGNSQDYFDLPEGPHTFQVKAVNQEGIEDPTPAIFTWTVNTSTLDTAITDQPDSISTSKSATFNFVGVDNIDGLAYYQVQLDKGRWIKVFTTSQGYTNLGQGQHTFQVRAVDNAGQVDPTPAIYTWTVDSIGANTTIGSKPPLNSTSASATFGFSATDTRGTGVAYFLFQLDEEEIDQTETDSVSFTDLAEGQHTFQVWAVDEAGNEDDTPALYTWTVDATPPDTIITSQPSALSKTTAATFNFSSGLANDPKIAFFEVRLDDGDFTKVKGIAKTFGRLAQGEHTFEVRAVDKAGNVDPSPAGFTWMVDTRGPDTTLTGQPALNSNTASATFTLNGDDDGSGLAHFLVKLDKGSVSTTTGTTLGFTNLTEGKHTLQVQAVDVAGNVDTTPAKYSWTVDTTPPTTTLVHKPAALVFTSTATFTFKGSKDAPYFETSLDGSTFTRAPGKSQQFTNLADGPHAFQVRAVDKAGNAATSVQHIWTVAPGAHWQFVQAPADGLAGQILTPVMIQLIDRSGNNLAQEGITVIVSLSPKNGLLGGTTKALTNSEGLVSFNDLAIQNPGTYSLVVASSSLPTLLSNTFDVSLDIA